MSSRTALTWAAAGELAINATTPTADNAPTKRRKDLTTGHPAPGSDPTPTSALVSDTPAIPDLTDGVMGLVAAVVDTNIDTYLNLAIDWQNTAYEFLGTINNLRPVIDAARTLAGTHPGEESFWEAWHGLVEAVGEFDRSETRRS